MCCEQLVCARCNGMVADGRCPTCRATRAELHGTNRGSQEWMLLLLAVLALATAFFLAVHPL